MKRREQKLDVKISDFIEKNMIGNLLFFTFNHPKSIVLLELMNGILDILGEKRIQTSEEFLRDYLGVLKYPVYISVQRFFNLDIPICLVYKNKIISIENMVKEYLKFYSLIKLQEWYG